MPWNTTLFDSGGKIKDARVTANPEVQPSWTNTFTNLPAPSEGIYYSVDLTDYGVDIEEVHAINTSRSLNNGESIWPEGLTLDTGTGVLSGVPTTEGDLAVVEVVGVNGTFDAAADWSYRSGLSNTFITIDFPDNASVRDISDNMSGNPARSIWDSSFKLFGNGALRQDTLDEDEYPSDTAGWMYPILGAGAVTGVPFTDADALASGEEMWICFSVYHNRADRDWIPAITQTVEHTAKIALIDIAAAGGAGEEQIAHQFQWGHFSGFQGKGTGRHWTADVNTACDATDLRMGTIDLGPNPLDGADPGLPSRAGGASPGSAWTQCQQDRARYGLLFSWWNGTTNPDDEGVCDPVAPGAAPFEWWYSQMLHIKRNGDGSTLIEWFHAPLGQDWTELFSKTETSWSYDWRRIQLTNSNGGGASDGIQPEVGVRPKYERWYDGFITRKGSARIPAPGFSS